MRSDTKTHCITAATNNTRTPALSINKRFVCQYKHLNFNTSGYAKCIPYSVNFVCMNFIARGAAKHKMCRLWLQDATESLIAHDGLLDGVLTLACCH